MPVYLKLFHGRKTAAEQLQDWGSEGPILGPLQYVHVTYVTDIKLETADGVSGVLRLEEDLIYYDGLYYGDWSIFGEDALSESGQQQTISQFDEKKAMRASVTARVLPVVPLGGLPEGRHSYVSKPLYVHEVFGRERGRTFQAGDVVRPTNYADWAFGDAVVLGFTSTGEAKLARPYAYVHSPGTTCPSVLIGCESIDYVSFDHLCKFWKKVAAGRVMGA